MSLLSFQRADEIGRFLAKQRKALRLTQVEAARQSGLSLAMLRRAESSGSIPLPKLLKLAATLNYELHFEKANGQTPSVESQTYSLNRRHPGLVWSNSTAPKEVYIRKALLNPRFGQLLNLAREFGLDSLQLEWRNLKAQIPGEAHRVEPEVARILRNMECGGGLVG